jgi:signal transduction histidine kinase
MFTAKQYLSRQLDEIVVKSFALTYRYSLIAIVATLVLGVAVLAALNLWYVRKLQGREVHATAAQTVLDLGSSMVRYLSTQVVQDAPGGGVSWNHLQQLLPALNQVEPALQYVSLTEGDVTLFHEDLTMESVEQTNSPPGNVLVGRRLLATSGGVVPVLTFTAPISGQGAPYRRLHLALKRDAVSQREAHAAAVLSLMFKLSLTTLIAAFLLAVLFIIWLFRHEVVFQRRQRDAEHLAFAGILANGIIHDVRNPLSSLRLDIQMLQKESGKGVSANSERMRELTERARSTMDRLDAVMKEFLFVSKPDASVLAPVDVNACVRDCVDLLHARFEKAGIKLEMTLDANNPFVSGHDVGLKRALTNVLINANQVSVTGGIVKVTTECAGGDVLIDVEDQGPGVSPRDASKIFDMFVSGRPEGIGLGLYLARLAVEKMSGRITVENRAQGGAIFRITLPLSNRGKAA